MQHVVRRASSPGGPFAELGRTQGNAFMDATAAGPGPFFYKIAGVNDSGVGLASPVTAVSPPSPELLAWLGTPPLDLTGEPEAVPGLAGEVEKRSVSLSWKLARRGWTYGILCGPTADGPFQIMAAGLKRTQWHEEDLPYGRDVYYTVAAVGLYGYRGQQATPLHFLPVDDTIPAPWKGADIGDVGAAGKDGFLNGAFTLHASGSDAWDSADSFHYVSQPLNGDGTIIACVTSQENVNEWAKAGLMIRATSDAGSQNAFLFTAPGHGIVFQTRTGPGGGTGATEGRDGFTPAPWLKLARVADVFTVSASPDGQTWTQIGTANIPMPKTVLIGLASLSHARGSLGHSRFDSVKLTRP